MKASSYKVTKASDHGAILVTEKWLLECVKQQKLVDEAPFQLNKAGASEVCSAYVV